MNSKIIKYIYILFIKNLLDRIFSLIALFLLLPLFVIVTILLTISNKGDAFFIQLRTGFNGNLFNIIKFKTMNDKKSIKGNLLSDDQRLTKIGKFVRKTSLDEIPQLVNVIKGDMSLIGPRPLLPEYLPLYDDVQKRRHEVKPGITGWAQVNGRNAISWEKKFEYDVWYIDNISLMLDIKIFFLTLKKVFFREGINMQGHVTTEAFKGN